MLRPLGQVDDDDVTQQQVIMVCSLLLDEIS